jgi:HlyD family type I secretion membrane fusion protein
MVEEKKQTTDDTNGEIIEIRPGESDSDNFLVTEQLKRMPGIFSRGLLYVVLVMLVAALIYSVAGKIDIVVESQSVARPESHKIKILSDRNGFIERIFISEGQSVEENSPLFIIRSKETLTYQSKVEELKKLIPLKNEYIDIKISSIREELRQIEDEYKNTLKVKKLKIEQNGISLNSIESDLQYWQKEVENLDKEFENTQRLFNKSLTSIGDYNNIKSRLERARTEVEKLTSQKEISIREKNIIEGEIGKAGSDYASSKKILEKHLKNLKIERETTLQSLQSELAINEKMLSIKDTSPVLQTSNQEGGRIIRAERSGTVSELYFRNRGEYVREADLLCTILPSDSPLYMDITVANKDVGFIEAGLAIKYKFDAFPYANYGMLDGKVYLVSPSAVEHDTLGFVYNVRGTLHRGYFEIKGGKYTVKAGMTATAEIITEKKSIFSILLKKLKGK